jgi:hypothetical protein
VGLDKAIKSVTWPLAAVLCLFLGFCSQKEGSEYIREMRQMERVPKVSVNHIISGEVSIEGTTQNSKASLRSRYTKTPCFYHRYLKEREETDSEGDTRWVTVERGSQLSDFFLGDKTGRVLVKLTRGGVSPDLHKDYEGESGRYRYTEWRIDRNENIYAFAMASTKSKEYYISFDQSGSYTPILSNDGALENRSSWGTKGIMFNALGISLFCFGCLYSCFLFRIHRVLVFLSLVSILVFLVLLFASMSMMKNDLQDGYDRMDRLEESSTTELKKILGNKALLDEKLIDRAKGIKKNYYASISRTNEILDRFPENLLAPLWGIKKWKLPEGMTGVDKEVIEKTPVKTWVVLVSMLVAMILILLGVYFGFRRIKIKRYVENIPTSLSSGISYGPSELKGRIEFTKDYAPLIGPETKEKCVYYRHKIIEKRRSGKKTKIVVIKDETHEIPFYCKDREGNTKIIPNGGEVTAELKFEKRRGRRTYYEWHLPENSEIYVLGSAVLDEVEGDSLAISDGKDKFPFIISSESETEVMLRQGRKGLLGLGVAQNATVFLGLVLFGAVGSFAATDFLLAAMFAPLFLAISMFALMYNDLIFLRNRVSRAWANIEVSLKKRSDLIPNLEQVVKSYFSHEQDVMRSVAELRSSVVGKSAFSPTDVDKVMGHELMVSNKIFALREAHPVLKSNEMMEDFMNRLARMENEVSMMRAGYNDGIERYRTVMQRFPEVMLAKMFGFKDQKSLAFKSHIRQVPKIELPANDNEGTYSGEELSQQSVEDDEGEDQVEEIEKKANQIASDAKQLSEIYLHKQGKQYGPFDMSQIEDFLIAKDFNLEDLACWDGKNWKKIEQIPGLNYPPK